MSIIKDNGKKLADNPVTLKILLTFSLPAIAVFSGLLGFMWSEIVDNRQFQIDQRIRVWDALTETQSELDDSKIAQARLEGQFSQTLVSLNRVIVRLDDLTRNRP